MKTKIIGLIGAMALGSNVYANDIQFAEECFESTLYNHIFDGFSGRHGAVCEARIKHNMDDFNRYIGSECTDVLRKETAKMFGRSGEPRFGYGPLGLLDKDTIKYDLCTVVKAHSGESLLPTTYECTEQGQEDIRRDCSKSYSLFGRPAYCMVATDMDILLDELCTRSIKRQKDTYGSSLVPDFDQCFEEAFKDTQLYNGGSTYGDMCQVLVKHNRPEFDAYVQDTCFQAVCDSSVSGLPDQAEDVCYAIVLDKDKQYKHFHDENECDYHVDFQLSDARKELKLPETY